MRNNSYDFEQAKAEYRAFCENGNHDIQIFAQPWYLDAVCDSPDDWKVILYKENDQIRGAFPFAYTKEKYGLWHIHNPWQAPREGIWIDYDENARLSTKEAYENKIVEMLISNLPYYDKLNIGFDARFQNWQQFYRHGFQQTGYYSYILQPQDDLLSTLSYNMRRETRLLQQNYHVEEQVSIEEYWTFFEKSYLERGRTASYSKEKFFELVQTVLAHEAGTLLACRDDAGKIFSVAGVFWDSRRMYNMFNTFDPTTKISTLPLVTLHAIKMASQKDLLFDFEGSMIPGVASYNMKFNSSKEIYFVISDCSDKYRILNGFREISQALKRLVKGMGKRDA